MNHFLIFGRPRSRTAWLANFLTYGNSFCLHEGLADAGGVHLALAKRMQESPAGVVGNADTGMIHELRASIDTFPNARLVLMTENEYSWRRFVTDRKIAKELVDQIDYDYFRARKELQGHALFMPVQQLTRDPVAAELLWNHCTQPFIGDFNSERFHLLKDLNVQVMPESLQRRIPGALPSR